jgi:hypothetical protein
MRLEGGVLQHAQTSVVEDLGRDRKGHQEIEAAQIVE